MLTFAMNTTNFGGYPGGGAASGTRPASAGVQLTPTEFAADVQTLGLWHLHQQNWADFSGNGHTLLPWAGATIGEQGVVCDSGSGNQYARTGSMNLCGNTAVTLECWFNLAALQSGGYGGLCGQGLNLLLLTYRTGNIFSVRFSLNYGIYAEYVFPSLPEVGVWHHAAGVWQRGTAGGIRVYVDGVAGATVASPADADLPSASPLFYVGAAQGTYYLDGLIDEVRVSTAARYTGNFTPARYPASGTFTSPVFDAGRTGARWLGVDAEAIVPPTAGLATSARIGDTLDGAGQVVGTWNPASGTLRHGRYLQWQTLLSRSTDPTGLTTPTLESVTATATDAGPGYAVYHGVGPTAAAIDYDTLAGCTGPGVLALTLSGLGAPGVHWFGVRSVDDNGVVSETTDAEVQLELDVLGNVVLPRPAAVQVLSAVAEAGGGVTLSWLAMPETGAVAPAAFRIYSDGGTGTVNFAAPLGSVAYVAGQRGYQWTSAAMTAGVTVQLAVRAESAAGGVDASPATVTVVPDAIGPAPAGQVNAATALAENA
jgi:hypothetical protein